MSDATWRIWRIRFAIAWSCMVLAVYVWNVGQAFLIAEHARIAQWCQWRNN
jgi:hypothetical protein